MLYNNIIYPVQYIPSFFRIYRFKTRARDSHRCNIKKRVYTHGPEIDSLRLYVLFPFLSVITIISVFFSSLIYIFIYLYLYLYMFIRLRLEVPPPRVPPSTTPSRTVWVGRWAYILNRVHAPIRISASNIRVSRVSRLCWFQHLSPIVDSRRGTARFVTYTHIYIYVHTYIYLYFYNTCTCTYI